MRRWTMIIAGTFAAAGIQGVIAGEFAFQQRLNFWEYGELNIPLAGQIPQDQQRPERDFPLGEMLTAIALGGAGIGWVFSNFREIDKRLDDLKDAQTVLDGKTSVAKVEGESSLLLLQRDLLLLQRDLERLKDEGTRRDDGLRIAIENLTEALAKAGIVSPRSINPNGRQWPADESTTAGFRVSTPPPSPPLT